MILGLPISTFFCTAIAWLLAIIAALIYGITYKDTDSWWTLDDLFVRKSNHKQQENNHEN